MDGIIKTQYVSNNRLAPFPSDSPHGHRKFSITDTSTLYRMVHQYIRKPTAAINIHGMINLVQLRGIPPQSAVASSDFETP